MRTTPAGPADEPRPAAEADPVGPDAAETDPAKAEADPADADAADPEARQAPLFDLAAALGGRRGIVDASLPGTVLVFVNVGAGLWWAIVAALLTAVGVGVLRLARHETLQQAASGVLGIALAAALAALTGKPKTFFLPGILINAGYVVACLASVAAGRPLLGYIAAALDARYAGWRADRRLRRAASYATLVWVGIFLVRAVVQSWLYLHDRVEWLATARLALGWPLWAVAVIGSLLLLQPARDARPAPAAAAVSPPAEPAAPA